MRNLNNLVIGLGFAMAAFTALPAAAGIPDPEHGIGVTKGCVSPKEIGENADCTFTAVYLDETLVDSIEITDVQDTVMSAAGPVVIPAADISIESISGGFGPTNTNCQLSNPAALPCRLCPPNSTLCGLAPGDPGFNEPGRVQFRSNTYVITADDASMANPLEDIVRIRRMDNCESEVPNCTMAPLSAFAGSETVILLPFVTVEKVCTECDLDTDPPFQSTATITVDNTGTGVATNCRVLDIFDEGGPLEVVLFDEMIPVLEPNTPQQFVVQTPGHMDDTNNEVTVTCDFVGPPAQTTDSATAVCPCGFEPPDVNLTKLCTECELFSNPPFLSDVTLTLTNDGTGPATNCEVVDTFDPGGPNEQVIFSQTIPNLPAGGPPMMFNFPTPAHQDTVPNQATVTCDPLPVGKTSDTANDDCECFFEPPIVTVTKQCSDCDPFTDPPFQSSTLITVNNVGTGNATNCRVLDTFDPGGADETILIDTMIAVLAPNDPMTFMPQTPGHLEQKDNVVTVTCDVLPPPAVTSAMADDPCECTFEPPIISVVKECTECDLFSDPPFESEATLTITNSGTGTATNCQVVDTFDPGGPLEQQIFSETIASIPPGEVVRMVTTPAHMQDVDNEVTVNCDFLPAPAVTSAQDEAVCECDFLPPVVELDKACTECELGSSPPFESQVTLTLTNSGTGPATNCQVVDTFDPGGPLEQEIFSQTVALLPAGGPPMVFNFPTPAHDDPVPNEATVTCDPLPPPAVTTDDAEDECECTFEPPLVGVTKDCSECDPNSEPPFESAVTITVTNTGTGPATNCQVVDTFDPGGPLEEVIFSTTIGTLPPPPDPNSTMIFNVDTPSHNEDVDNQVTVTCDPLPLGTTMAEGDDVCECAFVPPFVEVVKECGLCDPSTDPPNMAPIKITVTNTGFGPATNCRLVDLFDPEGTPQVLLDEDLGTLVAPSERVFEFPSPPILATTNNRATITCDEQPPPAQTMDVDEAACVCRPFVPPCRGLECNICVPDQLKGDDDDNETGF